jgi:hypothetical protein
MDIFPSFFLSIMAKGQVSLYYHLVSVYRLLSFTLFTFEFDLLRLNGIKHGRDNLGKGGFKFIHTLYFK